MLKEFCSDDHGTARGGCDDGFGVFGFLAFLLALLDLLLELGDDGRSGLLHNHLTTKDAVFVSKQSHCYHYPNLAQSMTEESTL